MIENLILFQLTISLFLGGAILGLVSGNGRFSRPLIFIPSMMGSILTILFSIAVIMTKSLSWGVPHIIPFFNLEIFVDGISAFFMLLIGIVSFAVSLYSVGYSKEYEIKKRISLFGFLFNIFILSMILVVGSNNGFFFLMFWELMSLTSFFLVIYDHDKEENVKSGMTYLVMTHFGTALIFVSFLLGYLQTGNFGFDFFRSSSSSFPHLIKDLIFVSSFIGFGTKAGIVPLHTWLPKAHPSAPSNVSALMSAVMIKMGIYGIIRTVFDFAGFVVSPDYAWWGVLMVIAGSASALIGILYAIVERDIKRALAFSSIENIGIILIGLGLSVIFASYNLHALSVLALVASMYHTINHAFFKGLLFMGAGSVAHATHTKDIEKLGGLVKQMPWTSMLFLIGAVSIAGLPPFNGFVSEWLGLQAILSSSQIPSTILQISIAFASLPFALTIGLAAATFVRLFSMIFLSKTRGTFLLHIREVPHNMIAGMAILASACILFGIVPFLGISLLSTAFHLPSSPSSPYDAIALKNNAMTSFANLSMPVVAIMLSAVALGILGFIRVVGGKTTKTIYGTWDCGFGKLNKRMEYTATSISQPIRVVFKSLFKPHNETHKEFSIPTNSYLVKAIKFNSTTKNIFEENLYTPIISSTLFLLDKVRKIQTGKINSYLLYIMITIILLLIFVRFSHA
ncbi:MAG: hydrogenase 4 subunit B [Thaumarchaeota archaeon]|nr:hydrogenase 4 subunit B [Nitrososphaerota archaeon]MDE1830858.1 hydrogenase 4 subunit B [Nitrososphaerota archaeon]MDE1841118.1 hydrogenase 4 subunit B [Nitrososphaerota archaeon]MDE1876944.1 hydrogenase 4 subunit B [Nitrososphaerota archaeon]